MEGDREVVREGEDTKEKRGWFSKDKKTAQNTQNVQRPPSSLSLPQHSSSSTTPSPGSDDLPERISRSSVQSGSPEDVPQDSMSSIPVHAGFDFKAINEILEREGANKEDELKGMQIPPKAPISQPSISTPGNILDHTLPVQAQSSRTPSRTPIGSGISSNLLPVHESHLDQDFASASASETRVDLVQTLTQSLSLDDKTRSASSNLQNLQGEPDPISNSPSNSSCAHTSQFAARPPPAPTLSFGSVNGSLWTSAADTITSQAHGEVVSKSPFAASTETLSLGSSTGPIPSHPNPFAASGLSFGSADGTISYGDPWSPPLKDGAPKKPSYSANPWDN